MLKVFSLWAHHDLQLNQRKIHIFQTRGQNTHFIELDLLLVFKPSPHHKFLKANTQYGLQYLLKNTMVTWALEKLLWSGAHYYRDVSITPDLYIATSIDTPAMCLIVCNVKKTKQNMISQITVVNGYNKWILATWEYIGVWFTGNIYLCA